MDILIKSFNRPYYLDRCISSIYKFVKGDLSIKVLDDGTLMKYLSKIQVKYPNVKIILSNSYIEKNKAIEENLLKGTEIDGFVVPIDMWIQAVQEASPYFIITEDDVWFTQEIDVDELSAEMKKYDISLLKLGWLGKEYPIQKLTDKIFSNRLSHLFTMPRPIMEKLIFNKYKLFSILYRLGRVNHNTMKDLWVLYSILMGMYKKEYWLEVWKDSDKINEKKQLLNASIYYREHRNNPNLIAQLNEEAMKTTFVSSATNSYHMYGYNFDVNRFNFIINEKWFNDEFDVLQNFPKDFSESYLISFLNQENHPNASAAEWKVWAEKFKAQYRKDGAQVDDN